MKQIRAAFTGLQLAIQFLTILPAKVQVLEDRMPGGEPRDWNLGRAAGWFPWVGLVIGLVAFAANWLAGLVLPPLPAAILSIAAWAALTGGLHLDGLADCCDAFFSAVPPRRRLEIMQDPRLGTFGAVGLLLHLILKAASVYSLPPEKAFPAFLLAGAAGRWLVLLANRQPFARPGGLGDSFAAGLRPRSFLVAAIPVLLLALLAGWWGAVAVAAAHLAGLVVFGLARLKIGGLTGDVLGFTVEAGELAVLLAAGAGLSSGLLWMG